MKLYTLRHRKGNHGVLLSFIEIKNPTGDEAKDFKIAEQIGVAYCDQHINCKYIRIEQAILADESILSEEVLEKIKNPPPPRVRPRLAPEADIADPDAKIGLEGAPVEKVRTPSSEGDLDKLNLGPDDDEEEEKDDEDPDEVEDDDDEEEEEQPKGKAKAAKPVVKPAAKPTTRKRTN